MRWVFVLVLLLSAGCGAEVPDVPVEVVQKRLASAAKEDPAPYYLGQSYRGLNVTDVDVVRGDVDAGPFTSITYGTCRMPMVGEGSCALPYEVQTRAFDPKPFTQAGGCARLNDINGVPAVDVGGGVFLFPRRLDVRIFTGSGDVDTARAAAEESRPISSKVGAPLERPDAATLKVIGAACGNSPGSRGPAAPGP